MKKLLVCITFLCVSRYVSAQDIILSEHESKIVLTGYFSRNFQAGGEFHSGSSFGFGVGKTFSQDRGFIEFNMKLRDKLYVNGESDSLYEVGMSSIIMRTGWNTTIFRAALISGPIIGPQIGYGFTKAGNKDIKNNPFYAGLYIQFNLNLLPEPWTVKIGKDRQTKTGFLPGIFVRPSYNFLINAPSESKSQGQFHGNLDLGFNLIVD